MDAFEKLVGVLLESNGYWVQCSFKVNLTKEDKRAIGRPTSPRWELDLVAYKGATNEIKVVECKSFLNSSGATFASLSKSKRYKLFRDIKLRRVVFKRLAAQLKLSKSCRPNPIITLCLAVAHIANDTNRQKIREKFERQKWQLMDENWLRETLKKIGNDSYQNDVAAIVTKLLIQN